MLTKRNSAERGFFDHSWLKTYHTFSFANYIDRRFMQFQSLRVINEDIIEAGQGFGLHPHENMEIITYLLAGELEHKDSMGNGSIIRAGDVQYMSAGSGLLHSEFNPSETKPVHLLQIWILPQKLGVEPTYSQKHFGPEDKLNRFCPIVTPDNAPGTIGIGQDVKLYASLLEPGRSLELVLDRSRFQWLQLMTGSITVNNTELGQGDGVALIGEAKLLVEASQRAEFLLFDLAKYQKGN